LTETLKAGSRVSIALLHHPVFDRNRRVVATAITNLDLHDMARLARTFGLFRFYVVTPVEEQRALAERIRSHWRDGWGAGYNPDRREALELVRVEPDLDVVLADLESIGRQPARMVVTGAKEHPGAVSFDGLRSRILEGGDHFLLLFGTGWGLTDEIFRRADYVLEPVRGAGDYNHLPVRAAAAIIVDRLLGQR
jgi:hypothetical protein